MKGWQVPEDRLLKRHNTEEGNPRALRRKKASVVSEGRKETILKDLHSTTMNSHSRN